MRVSICLSYVPIYLAPVILSFLTLRSSRTKGWIGGGRDRNAKCSGSTLSARSSSYRCRPRLILSNLSPFQDIIGILLVFETVGTGTVSSGDHGTARVAKREIVSYRSICRSLCLAMLLLELETGGGSSVPMGSCRARSGLDLDIFEVGR